MTRWTAAAGVAALVTLGAGCASNDEVASLRAGIESASAAAMAAQEAAAGAAADAEAARAEAGQASRTANRALSAAREGQTCCAANSEKIDRMFKKSMMK